MLDSKFIESVDVSEWEIETDTGWEDIASSHKTIIFDEWKLTLENDEQLICADDHIVFNDTYNEIYVKDCIQNTTKIITKNGPKLVKSVEKTDNRSHMYDLEINSNNHRYYTNNVLSHNTTIVGAYLLHYAIFNSDKKVGILANRSKTARSILQRMQRMYENLPLWLQPGVKVWNKGDIELDNGSIIIADSTSSSSIRGESLNLLYLDEFAFVKQQVDFWESTYPVITAGSTSKVIITSTPNGLDLFYKIYDEAERGVNDFYPISVHWSEHPDRDERWKLQTQRNIGIDQFRQEFETEFLGSSSTLVTGSVLKTLTSKEPIHKGNDLFNIFEMPQRDRIYALIADVSRGKGLDYSAFSVIDITEIPYRQVAIFRDNMISPTEYAEVIDRVGKQYNEATVLIELNDLGSQVSDILFDDYEYENMIYTESAGRLGKKISYRLGRNVDRGITTTKSVKATGCSVLKLLIEQSQLILNDIHTIEELKTFSRRLNSYEAEPGNHDDLVMGLVLFAWLTTQQYFSDLTDINTMATLRERSREELENEMMPLGFMDDGIENDISNTPIVVGVDNEDSWLDGNDIF